MRNRSRTVTTRFWGEATGLPAAAAMRRAMRGMRRLNPAILARESGWQLKRCDHSRLRIPDAPAIDRFVLVGHPEGRPARHEEVCHRLETDRHADAGEPSVMADDVDASDPE